MNKSSGILKVVGYSFGASVAASLSVFLIGACVLGFQLARWAESDGELVGMVGTIAGVAGAVVGLRMALRTPERPVNR